MEVLGQFTIHAHLARNLSKRYKQGEISYSEFRERSLIYCCTARDRKTQHIFSYEVGAYLMAC